MLSTRHRVRALASGDLADLVALTARHPAQNVFVAHRAINSSLNPRLLGTEIWGRFDHDTLVAAIHVGANLVPVEATPEDAAVFATRLRQRRRTVSTLVGEVSAIRAVWEVVGPAWGAPREFRWDQPHLIVDGPPLIEPHPAVRRSTLDELELVYPACVAMYTEEVGVSPDQDGSGGVYRARVRHLINNRWSFVLIEEGELIFKAEVASATYAAAQIQGVWVAPGHRGRGLAAPCMAAVCELVRRDIAPIVGLYVNAWNEPARAAYERVGFRQTGTFATIMY